jgi:hypothetical protein
MPDNYLWSSETWIDKLDYQFISNRSNFFSIKKAIITKKNFKFHRFLVSSKIRNDSKLTEKQKKV